MSFLITGSHGQLGQEFCNYFKEEKIPFIASARSSSSDLLDISDINDVRNFVIDKDVEAIINCAAYNLVDKAESDWISAYKTNSLGPRNLSIVANELNVPIIHFSTDYVFDGTKSSPYTIFDTPRPLSNYARSKFYGEQFVRQLAQKYFLIRLSWVFGPGIQNFISKVITWSKDKSTLKIVVDEVSSPTYTADVVKATINLFESKIFGLYHFCNQDSCSRFEWAQFILEQIKWPGKLLETTNKEFNLPATRPNYSVLDATDMYDIISYEVPDWKIATKNYLQRKELKL